MLDEVDAGRNAEDLQVLEQLRNQYQLARRLAAEPEDDLGLVHGEDLVLLDEHELLFGHVLAVVLGQEFAVPDEQLPECLDAFERGQFGRRTSIHHFSVEGGLDRRKFKD